ncbi:MAG: hypothetical protein ACK41V_08900 [Acidovorax sp.]|uniref:hypothetical protein n=1 Tax=Acidovorax sp. TaxID=1872122 RepID=UPI0039196A4E
MSPYTYSGPLSGVTLADGKEVVLIPGATVHLPADHDYTRTLIARKHLVPVPSVPQAPKAARAPKPKSAPSTPITGS